MAQQKSSWRLTIRYTIIAAISILFVFSLSDVRSAAVAKVIDEFAASGRYFNWKGSPIFYLYENTSNPIPLVFLHGYPTSSHDFVEMAESLRRHFPLRTLLFDFIGFGLSAKPVDGSISLQNQTDLTVDLLKSLSLIGTIHFVAHDYGVSVAQELLARESDGTLPFRIGSVLFLNGGVIPSAHRPVLMQRLLQHHISGPILQRFFNFRLFSRSFSNVFGPRTKPTAGQLEVFYWFIRHNYGELMQHKLLQYMPERKATSQRWVEALNRTTVPIKFLNGPADPVSGRHVALAVEQLLGSKANLKYLADDIGHYPQVEDLPAVLQHYKTFLATLPDLK